MSRAHIVFRRGPLQYKLEPVPLMGRSAILGDQRNNYFCGVACGKGDSVDSTYAITKSGLLCEFNSRRLLDKWVELRVMPVFLLFSFCFRNYAPAGTCYSPRFITTLKTFKTNCFRELKSQLMISALHVPVCVRFFMEVCSEGLWRAYAMRGTSLSCPCPCLLACDCPFCRARNL